VRDPKAKPRKRYDGTASRVISTGVFVALEALLFQIIRDFGKLSEATRRSSVTFGGDHYLVDVSVFSTFALVARARSIISRTSSARI
jgi:hypothetical protein